MFQQDNDPKRAYPICIIIEQKKVCVLLLVYLGNQKQIRRSGTTKSGRYYKAYYSIYDPLGGIVELMQCCVYPSGTKMLLIVYPTTLFWTYIVPELGMPIVCIVVMTNWKKKIKKNTIKLNDESERNALYAGRNQQRYEKGVNNIAYSTPNPIMVKSSMITPPRTLTNISIPWTKTQTSVDEGYSRENLQIHK